MRSAITHEFTKLNDSRIYKAANKMAAKVTKTSKRAWYKLRKLAKKLSQSKDDLHYPERYSNTKYTTSHHKGKHSRQDKFTEHKKQRKENRSDKHVTWSKLYDSSDQNHEESNSKQKRDYHHSDMEEQVEPNFDVIVSDHVTMVKEAGEAVMHQLVPVYQKCEEVYHDVKGKIAQKSFQEVWNSVVDSTKTGRASGSYVWEIMFHNW